MVMQNFDAVIVEAKSGQELFCHGDLSSDIKLINFWRWSQSDLLNNSLRGVLAEFIVAQDLGKTTGSRVEWDAFDIITKDGVKIEVKSSAYLQSWKQKKLSNIAFDIRPTFGFCEETNSYTLGLQRQSDFYVFCLLKHKDKATVNPLDLDQWRFFVLPTTILNERVASQKSISLNSLLKLQPFECKFGEIKETIEAKSKHLF